MVWLFLWAVAVWGRIAPPSLDTVGAGVPFAAAPPCTTPLGVTHLALRFVGPHNNVSLTGVLAVAASWPGLSPRSALRVVCGSAVLVASGVSTRVVLEGAGPRPSPSRVFHENHPGRQGGFLADNVLLGTADPLLSREGLLFRSHDRYDEANPPTSGDGPAPGPGRCGGFELNVFYDAARGGYVLLRYAAGSEQRIDLESVGTLTVGTSSSANNATCSVDLRKHMWDMSVVRGEDVLAAGSFATVSGLPGLPPHSALAVAGGLELSVEAARGGPRQYDLVPLGPYQVYSPIYYAEGNGFFFFNNIVFSESPHLDMNGMILAAARGGGRFELNVYFQNEVGVTCDGSVKPARCREVKDGSGAALWVYEASKDRLHEKSFGHVVLRPRRTCSVAHPLTLREDREAEPVAEPDAKGVVSSDGGSSWTAVATACVAVAASAVAWWFLQNPKSTT